MRALLIPALLAGLALLAVVWHRWASPEAASRRRRAREQAARDAVRDARNAEQAAIAAEEARIRQAWDHDLYDPAHDPFTRHPPAQDQNESQERP
jgi:hypothetical protein